jgi:SAM-dependent methyltransferase
MERYDEKFYLEFQDGSIRSAREILPIVIGLVQPRSVVDVGCGIGTWLAVVQECGIDDITGIDGDYVNRSLLKIPQEKFAPFDLKEPIHLDRRFDLVVSLEVAEHLPAECAETFVESLTRLGPVVLFSAAMPFQGGVNHINERWPDYWLCIFTKLGYVAIDCVRKRVWENENVEWWYAQNTLIFADRDQLDRYPLLKSEQAATGSTPLLLVHPANYLSKVAAISDYSVRVDECNAKIEEYKKMLDPNYMSLKQTLSLLPVLLKNALKKRLKPGYWKHRAAVNQTASS